MLQMQSTVTADGHLELAVAEAPAPTPGPAEVLIRVEAAPINPSDLGLLFGGADMTAAQTIDGGVRAPIPPEALAVMGHRVGRAMRCGNEGAGVVVGAGEDAAAQALIGKTVATLGGSMYAQFKVAPAEQCLVLHEGTTAAEGASCFVNPLTVLGMVDTMRLEGHTALAHTAAASNLGQMLQKVCTNEGVPLVNIVRREEHVDLLRGHRGRARGQLQQGHVPRRPDRRLRGNRRNARLRRDRRRAFGGPTSSVHGSRPVPEPVPPPTPTAPRPTSRSTSTGASNAARRCSTAPSAWPGASAAGCCPCS